MLYPFSITFDSYIEAKSEEEAAKLVEAYVQDAGLNTAGYPEIAEEETTVSEYSVAGDYENYFILV